MMHNKIKIVLTFLMICLFLTIQAQTNTYIRDTIFIKYDKKFLIKKIHPYKNYTYYYFKNSGNNGSFFLKEKRISLIKTFKNKTTCVKKILNKKQFYNGKNNTKIIDDWELLEYFNDKTVFLVKNDSIIELEPNYVIE